MTLFPLFFRIYCLPNFSIRFSSSQSAAFERFVSVPIQLDAIKASPVSLNPYRISLLPIAPFNDSEISRSVLSSAHFSKRLKTILNFIYISTINRQQQQEQQEQQAQQEIKKVTLEGSSKHEAAAGAAVGSTVELIALKNKKKKNKNSLIQQTTFSHRLVFLSLEIFNLSNCTAECFSVENSNVNSIRVKPFSTARYGNKQSNNKIKNKFLFIQYTLRVILFMHIYGLYTLCINIYIHYIYYVGYTVYDIYYT